MIEAHTMFGRSPSNGRKLDRVWSAMLARTHQDKPFDAGAIATAAGASPRFVRAYCKILEATGYLVMTRRRKPYRYQVGPHYRASLAPQLAGGSGGGKALGKGWQDLSKIPPPAPKAPRPKRPADRRSVARSKRRRAAVRSKQRKGRR